MSTETDDSGNSQENFEVDEDEFLDSNKTNNSSNENQNIVQGPACDTIEIEAPQFVALVKVKNMRHRNQKNIQKMVPSSATEGTRQVLPQKEKRKSKSADGVRSGSPGTVCPEVLEYMNFITASGGHENGWPVELHNFYLKIRSKSRDPRVLYKYLSAAVPGITENDIITHETWYRMYLLLTDRKKKAIKNWRENKTKQKEESNQEKTEGKKLYQKYICALKKQQVEQWKAQKEAEQRRAEQMENEFKMQEQTAIKSHYEKLKQKVEMWKAHKRAMQSEEDHIMKNLELKKDLREELHKEQYMKKKLEVKMWRKKRQAKVEAEEKEKKEMEKKNREERRKKANKLIKEYLKQHKLFIAGKREQSKGSNSRKNKNKKGSKWESDSGNWPSLKSDKLKQYRQHNFHLNTLPKLPRSEWKQLFETF